MLMIACLVLKNNKRTTCNWKWIALMLKADTNGILWCFTDISKSRGEAPAQPQLNFPKTLQEDWNRSFKGEWYAVHPWLEYSISEDSTSNKQKRQLCKIIYMDLPTLTHTLSSTHTHFKYAGGEKWLCVTLWLKQNTLLLFQTHAIIANGNN